ncbi:unnamed protein product [Acanthoscelides obtectus]|uniref:Uncharacterized protein n=1 Tax=Acanthoscelides obtectus TaxID=200917 RepID=A0A9P0LC09_ACAOB|nr:unnamed protein product [Acanthoscelides obtectus]CAK1684076.1 hypothetical protein AOBTE_LOCUS34607 [Acanthoscelides obtectus]
MVSAFIHPDSLHTLEDPVGVPFKKCCCILTPGKIKNGGMYWPTALKQHATLIFVPFSAEDTFMTLRVPIGLGVLVGTVEQPNMPVSTGRFRCTFTNEQMENLRQYVEDVNKRAFGITREQFARIVYDYAETLRISHRLTILLRRQEKTLFKTLWKNLGFH